MGRRCGPTLGWYTAYEIDFTAQTPATYTANGTYTIGGQSWVLSGYNTGVTADLSAANGLRLQIAASTATRRPTWTSPSFSTLGVGGSRYQLWAYYGPSLASAGTGSADSAVENVITNSRAANTHFLWTFHQWFAVAYGGQPIGNSFATHILGGPSYPTWYPATPNERASNTTGGISSTGPNVVVMEFSGGDRVDIWTGTWSSGWPTWQSLTYRGYVSMNLATNPQSSAATISLMGPGEPAYQFITSSTSTSTATTGNLRNMRIMTR